MNEAKRGGLQFSVRTLLLVTAAVALLLVPVAWVTRERQQLMRAQQEILLARELALRSVVREEQRRRGEAASPSEDVAPQVSSSPDRNLPLAEKLPAIEQLRHENADLRQQLEQLRREVEQLKNPAKPTGKSGR
jgi:predicted RNase H-like nuclease (RuvC/YqgF family)